MNRHFNPRPSHGLSRRLKHSVSLSTLAAACMGATIVHAQALPTGGTVAGGSVSISAPDAGQLRVQQTSNRAVINWNSFNVGTGGRFTVEQPDAASALLNRVTGGTRSLIDGRIESNGRVFLINPNGIAIGSDGMVDTRGGFIASTLDLTDTDFMDGDQRFAFSGHATHISNAGTITAGDFGYVGLLAGTIDNSGEIIVPSGRIEIAASGRTTLDLSGSGFLQIDIGGLSSADRNITNNGSITASGGQITLSAQATIDAARRVINMPGSLSASTVSGTAGRISISSPGTIEITGSVAADSADRDGGSIFVNGASVDMTGARLSVDAGDGALANPDGAGGSIVIGANAYGVAGNLILTDTILSARGDRFGGFISVGNQNFHGGLGSDDLWQDHDFRRGVANGYPTRTVTIAGGRIDAANRYTSDYWAGGGVVISSLAETRLSGVDIRVGVATTAGELDNRAVAGALEISSRGSVVGLKLDDLELGFGDRFLLGADRIALLEDDDADDATTSVDGETRLRASALNRLIGRNNLDIEGTTGLRFSGAITGSIADPAGQNGLRLTSGGRLTLAGSITTQGSKVSLIAGDRLANGVNTEARSDLARAIDAAGLSIDAGGSEVVLDADDEILTPALITARTITATSARLRLGGMFTASESLILTGTNAIELDRDTVLNGQASMTGVLRGGGGVATLRQYSDGLLQRFVKLGAGEIIAAAFSLRGGDVTGVYGDDPSGASHLVVDAGGLKPGDDLTTLLARGALSYNLDRPGVGRWIYRLTPAEAFDLGAGLTGYDFTFGAVPQGQLTVTPRPVHVSLVGGASRYGDPVFLVRSGDILAGDDIRFSGTIGGAAARASRPTDSDGDFQLEGLLGVGDHRFNFLGFDDAFDHSNYTLTPPAISAVDLTVTPLASLLPTGGVVTRGNASIGQTGNLLSVIQTSDRAVIDWTSFSVGFGSRIDFQQPGLDSMTLNRVGLGAGLSAIDGQITSNGAVWLINPNGIAIGATGAIDTRGGFIASTLDADDDDFLGHERSGAGLTFTGLTAGVLTQAGTINVDPYRSVILLGNRIVSSGAVNASRGYITLGAGSAADLDWGRISPVANVTAAALFDGGSNAPLVSQTGGTFTAAGGMVSIQAFGTDDLRPAIALGGRINVDSFTDTYGFVSVRAWGGGDISISGDISASGRDYNSSPAWNEDWGGYISILGDGDLTLSGRLRAVGAKGGHIDVAARGAMSLTGALVDVHGSHQGGLIRLGGSFRDGAADDGSNEYRLFVGRFGSFTPFGPLNLTASSVTIDAATHLIADWGVTGLDERFRDGVGGTIIVRAIDHVSLHAQLGRDTYSGYAGDGALSVSSRGTLDFAPGLAELDFEHLILGARNLTLADGVTAAPGESVVSLSLLRNLDAARGDGSNLLTSLSLEASDILRLPQGFAPNTTEAAREFRTQSLNLRAGRRVELNGLFQTVGGSTLIEAGGDANNGIGAERGAGPASIDASGARLVSFAHGPQDSGAITSPGAFILRLADGGAGGGIRLPTLVAASSDPTRVGMADFGDLTIDAGAGDIVFTGDVRVADRLKRLGYLGSDVVLKDFSARLSLTGNLRFAADATIAAAVLDWTNEATGAIGGASGVAPGFAARIALEQAGVALYRGTVGSGVAARLDFSGLGLGRGATATYGVTAADLTGLALRLRSGSLAPGDTLASLLAAGSLNIRDATGDRLQVGTRTLTVATGPDFAVADGKVGYVFAMSGPSAGEVTITPRTLTYSIGDVGSTYGTLAVLSRANLSGVLSGDTVGADLMLSQGGSIHALIERLAAGAYRIDVGALNGVSAGNYTLATSGNTAGRLTVSRRTVDFAGPTINTTYGNLAVLGGGIFTGVLAGDDLWASLALGNGGGATFAPTARLDAGAYDIVLSALGGASAGNYVLGSNTSGLLTVARRTLTTSLFSGSYVYGSPVALISLNGLLSGDAVAPTAILAGAAMTLTRIGSGFGAPEDLGVGTRDYAVTGLTGAAAGNYVLAGALASSFTITPRDLRIDLNARVNNASYVYGSPLSIVNLAGLRAGDTVSPLVRLPTGDVELGAVGSGYGFAANTGVGSYNFELIGLSGVAAGNYRMVINGSASGLVVITPRRLEWSTADLTSLYGDLARPEVTLAGMLAGDRVSAALAASRDGSPVTLAARSQVGQYLLGAGALSGEDAHNYVLDASGTYVGRLTINPRALGYSIASITSVYGELATPAAVLDNLLAGDDVTAGVLVRRNAATVTLTNTSGVGDYGLTIAGLTGAAASNYILGAGAGGTLSITPRALDVSIADISTIYGVRAMPIAVLHNKLDGDLVSAVLDVTGTDGASVTLEDRTGVGRYLASVLGISGAAAANYSIGSIRVGTISINPRTLDYSIGSGASIYGETFTPSAVLNGLLAGDSVEAGVLAFLNGAGTTLGARSAVGTYDLRIGQLSGAASANYVIAAGIDGRLTINPRSIGLGGGWLNSTYGDLLTLPTGLFGVLEGDDVNASQAFINAQTQATVTYGERTAAGDYRLVLTGLGGAAAGNYRIDSSGDIGITIERRQLSLGALQLSAVYGDAWLTTAATALQGLLTGELSGLLDGDDVMGRLVFDRAAFNASGRLKAGTYAITQAGADPLVGRDAANYYLSGTTRGRLQVRPFQLGADWLTTGFVYGSPTALGRLTGVFQGDEIYARILVDNSFSLGLGEVPSARAFQAGVHSLTFSGLTGSEQGDYLAPTLNHKITVTPKAVFGSISGGDHVYGDETAPKTTLAGVLDGDQITSAISLKDEFGVTSAFSQRSAAGVYTASLNLAGLSAHNYVVSADTNAVSLRITPRTLTLAPGGDSRVYGDDHVPGAGLSGLMWFDTGVSTLAQVTGLNGQVYSGADSNVGSYRVTVSGLTGTGAANYRLVGADTFDFLITPRPITAFLTAGNFVYGDGPGGGSLVQLVGLTVRDLGVVAAALRLIDGQGVSTDFTTRTNVGAYTTYAALMGPTDRMANYVLTNAPQSTLTVTPRSLNYSITHPSSATYGDAAPFQTVLSGLVNGEVATAVTRLLDGSGGVIATSDADGRGTAPIGLGIGAYTLRVTGLLGDASTGFLSSNYRLVGSDGALTLTPRPFSFTGSVLSRTYGAGHPSGLGGPASTIYGDLKGILAQDLAGLSVSYDAEGNGSRLLDPTAWTLDVGAYAVTFRSLSGAAASNYVHDASGGSPGRLTVTPFQINGSISDITTVFGDQVRFGGLVGQGVLPDDAAWLMVNLSTRKGLQVLRSGIDNNFDNRTPAGTHQMVVAGVQGPKASNYVLGAIRPGLLTITPRPISVTLFDRRRAFDEPLISDFYFRRSEPFIYDDDVSIRIDGDWRRNAGTYSIEAALIGADASNYLFDVTPGVLTIDPASITFNFAGQSLFSIYGDPLRQSFRSVRTNELIELPHSIVLEDRNSGAIVTGQRPDAGYNYFANFSILDPNYALVSSRIPYEIRPRAVTAYASTGVYGDQPRLNPSGVLSGDTVMVLGLRFEAGGRSYAPWNIDGSFAPNAEYFDELPQAGVDYNVTAALLSGASAGNYVYMGGTVRFAPRPITITSFGAGTTSIWGDTPLGFVGRVIDQFNVDPGVTYSNLVFASHSRMIAPGMSRTVMVDGKAVAVSNLDVGRYDWAATGLVERQFNTGQIVDCNSTLCVSSNYVLVPGGPVISGVLDIIPRRVRYTATGGSTTYGDSARLSVELFGLPTSLRDRIHPNIGLAKDGVFLGDGLSNLVSGSTFATEVQRAPAGQLQVVINSAQGIKPGNIEWWTANPAYLNVAPRAVTYTTYDGYAFRELGPVPGSLNQMLSPRLTGVLEGDRVSAVLKLNDFWFTDFAPNSARFKSGQYKVQVAYLSGPDGDNYTVADTGNTSGVFTLRSISTIDRATSLLGSNLGTRVVEGLTDEADRQARAAAALALTEATPADRSADATAGTTGAKVVITNTLRTDLGPIEGAYKSSSKFSISPVGLSVKTNEEAGLTYSVNVPVGYGNLTNTVSLGAYGASNLSLGVTGLKIASEMGVQAKDMIIWTGGCGAGSCTASSYVQAGLIANSTMQFNTDGTKIENTFGANAGVGGGGSATMDWGGVTGGGGVTVGEFAAGFGVDHAFSATQIKLGLSARIGVGVIAVDLNLSISLTPFGSIEAYTVDIDPAATAARLTQQEAFSRQAAQLRTEQQMYVAEVLNGHFSNIEAIDARGRELIAAATDLERRASWEGFAVVANSRAVAVNDERAPNTVTMYRMSGGWGNTLNDAVTSNWAGGLADAAVSAGNTVADGLRNVGESIRDGITGLF